MSLVCSDCVVPAIQSKIIVNGLTNIFHDMSKQTTFSLLLWGVSGLVAVILTVRWFI